MGSYILSRGSLKTEAGHVLPDGPEFRGKIVMSWNGAKCDRTKKLREI